MNIHRPIPNPHSGFTLIETLIYLGLFGLLMLGGFASMISLEESGQRSRTEAHLQLDATFIAERLAMQIEQNQTPVVPAIDRSEQIKDISFETSVSEDNPAHTTFSFRLESISDPSVDAITVRRTVYLTP